MNELPTGSFRTLRTRLLAYLCLLLAVCGPVIAGEVTGAIAPGQAAKVAPVTIGGVVGPSPRSSPGIVQAIAVDQNGSVLINGTISLPAASPVLVTAASPIPVWDNGGNLSIDDGAGSITVDTAAGVPLNVLVQPSPVVLAASQPAANVTLPSASPVPVMQNAYATATGYATYCSPSFAGGSSETTVKGSAGVLVACSCSNPNTTDVYLEFWDNSNPAPGTTAPDLCFCVPGGTGSSNRAMYDLVLPAPGWAFATACTVAVVTTANGSSTPGSAVTLNAIYK